MEIQVNEVEYCKLEVHYEADAEQIEQKKSEVISLFKKAPVPGFRTGKANIEVIKVHYKKQIEESLKRALAEEAFHNTMFEKDIRPLGQPDFTSLLLQGNKFTCDFSIAKKPDFDLGQYKDFEIPKPPVNSSVEELTEKMLEDLRYQNGEMVSYNDTDFVQMSDKVIVKYDAFLDDVKQDNLSSEGELLVVGSSALNEFDQNLLGMTVGETREFFITVPDSGLPKYQNKQIKYSVTVTMGSKVNKMPLDDSLANKVGKNTYAELRSYISGVASSKAKEEERSAILNQIIAKLASEHDFKVPNWLALSEAQYLVLNSKLDWNTLSDEDKEMYLQRASDNVKLALILDKIREKEPEAQLSDQEVIEIIKQKITQSGQNIDEVLQNMNRNGYLPVLIARLRDENTLDFLMRNSKVIE